MQCKLQILNATITFDETFINFTLLIIHTRIQMSRMIVGKMLCKRSLVAML